MINKIIIFILASIGALILIAEILATYSSPVIKGKDFKYSMTKNIYRMSLVILLEIGVVIAWIITKE